MIPSHAIHCHPSPPSPLIIHSLQMLARLVILLIFGISTALLLQFGMRVALMHACLHIIIITVVLSVCGLSCIPAAGHRRGASHSHRGRSQFRLTASLAPVDCSPDDSAALLARQPAPWHTPTRPAPPAHSATLHLPSGRPARALDSRPLAHPAPRALPCTRGAIISRPSACAARGQCPHDVASATLASATPTTSPQVAATLCALTHRRGPHPPAALHHPGDSARHRLSPSPPTRLSSSSPLRLGSCRTAPLALAGSGGHAPTALVDQRMGE